MRENDTAGWDLAVGQAWVSFQARLADQLAEMADGDVLIVNAMVFDKDEPGAAPYVQFAAWGKGMLRGEVASNQVLMVPLELDEQGERAIEELGYLGPSRDVDDPPDVGSVNYYMDLPRADADRLAVISVRVLRDVFGVAHPALLTGDVSDESVPEEAAAYDRTDEPVAAYPLGGHEELTALVDRALTPYFGHVPRRDGDGDIPVDLGRTVLFIRVHEDAPVVELFACVATDVEDLEAAAFEVGVLNRDERFLKFRLLEDSIVAVLQLPGWPFVPDHLRALLSLMTETVERVADDLVERVSGAHLLGGAEDEDEEEEDEEEDEAEEDDDEEDDDEEEEESESESGGRWFGASPMRIIHELNEEQPDSVGPELAASICGNDPEVIIQMIRVEDREMRAWGEARDECLAAGDPDVEGCDREIAYSERAISLLRRALRVLMERQAARDEAQQAPVVRRHERRHPPRPPRPRRVPDPTLEEVDPEIWR